MWGEPVAFDEKSDRKQIARALEADVRRRTVQTLRGRGDEATSSSGVGS
jgi:hypothetical protein